MYPRLIFALALCLLLPFGCKKPSPTVNYTIQKSIIAKNAVVSTAHPLASEIGLQVIKDGGNAIDAAIAVQFALAVVYPVAGNIGGGGFLTYRSNDGKVKTCLDFREKAPAEASRDMYLDAEGNVVQGKSTDGHLAAGVPGSVDGCWQMFQKYSKLKNWKRLLEPAVLLAENGFSITQSEADGLNEYRTGFVKNNTKPCVFVKKDTLEKWKKGDLLQQKDLATTLRAIRDQGRDGFYKGKVADLLVAEMKRGGGLINEQDLANYQAIWREPLQGNYRGYDIISMPPPSSGGIALFQLLGMVEPFDFGRYGFHSPEHIHLFVEAERRVYADRAKHLGDADYYQVPMAQLLDSLYILRRFLDFDPQKATPSSAVLAGVFARKESPQTTHFSIVDPEGNAAAVTTTLNAGYGSMTVVGGAGFLLNNEMDDFSAKPGVPNLYGALGGEANAIQAGKRPLSSMTPTIVTKDGQLYMVLGTPGGTTIITSVFQVLTNVVDFKMSMTEATHAPRFHSQWSPDELYLEKNAASAETREKLKKMGHKVVEWPGIGQFESIMWRKDGKLEGVADKRAADDSVSGY
jgi:gamma-glutamyltranspeptidase / glutathione hydrolase